MVVRRMLALATVVALCVPATAHARKDVEVRYRLHQVWATAVRLVRVDYRFPIRDRDEKVGYLLFDYQDGNRSYPGSFEIVETRIDGEKQVRAVLSIPDMPGYIERMMLDKLEKKLERDYGEPPPPRPSRKQDQERSDDEDDEDDDEDGEEEPDEGGDEG